MELVVKVGVSVVSKNEDATLEEVKEKINQEVAKATKDTDRFLEITVVQGRVLVKKDFQ